MAGATSSTSSTADTALRKHHQHQPRQVQARSISCGNHHPYCSTTFAVNNQGTHQGEHHVYQPRLLPTKAQARASATSISRGSNIYSAARTKNHEYSPREKITTLTAIGLEHQPRQLPTQAEHHEHRPWPLAPRALVQPSIMSISCGIYHLQCCANEAS